MASSISIEKSIKGILLSLNQQAQSRQLKETGMTKTKLREMRKRREGTSNKSPVVSQDQHAEQNYNRASYQRHQPEIRKISSQN